MRFTLGGAIQQFDATPLDSAELEQTHLELGPHGGIVVAIRVAFGPDARNPDQPDATVRIGFTAASPTVIPLVARYPLHLRTNRCGIDLVRVIPVRFVRRHQYWIKTFAYEIRLLDAVATLANLVGKGLRDRKGQRGLAWMRND